MVGSIACHLRATARRGGSLNSAADCHRVPCARHLSYLLFILLPVAGAVTWMSLGNCQRGRLLVSVGLLGYTNASFDAQGLQTHEGLAVCTVADGMRAVVLQVSNASPFAVLRGRSPLITFDSPADRIEYVPTGWNVLQSRECERFMLEPPTNGTHWRLTIGCERFEGGS